MRSSTQVRKVEIHRKVGRWAVPFRQPARYKGASGGRASGKSHHFAEDAVECMLHDPDLRFVCIREIQRSLRYSAKALIEKKIRTMVPDHTKHFRILDNEIRRVGGSGIMIFQGMQDYTADSIKSLEGFKRAWVEEAQTISARSLDLLIPTILRIADAEIWFSWNPENDTDAVDRLFNERLKNDPDAIHVHSNYMQNPMRPDIVTQEAERMRAIDPEAYAHIWLGGYSERSDAKVLAGLYRVDEFEPREDWDGPYHGADHGFGTDPRTMARVWVHDNKLYVEYESYHVGLSIDSTARQWAIDVPGFRDYVVRAESAEPGTNDYLRRHGVPRLEGVKKWPGSVNDGIAHLHSYDEIIIHPRCVHAYEEARLYSYKIDKRSGDILPKIEDRHNHIWDAIRYALAPMIIPGTGRQFAVSKPITRPSVQDNAPVPTTDKRSAKDESPRKTFAVSRPSGRR